MGQCLATPCGHDLMLNSGELFHETMTVLGNVMEHSFKIVMGMGVWKDVQGVLSGEATPTAQRVCVPLPVTPGTVAWLGGYFQH